jgi:hypothetical protein
MATSFILSQTKGGKIRAKMSPKTNSRLRGFFRLKIAMPAQLPESELSVIERVKQGSIN